MYTLYCIEIFMIRLAAKYDKKRKKLLDIGAGTKPSKKYFKNLVYLSHEIKQDKNSSYKFIGDLDKSPLRIKNVTIHTSTRILSS